MPQIPPAQKISAYHPQITPISTPIHLNSASDPASTKNKHLSPPNNLKIRTYIHLNSASDPTTTKKQCLSPPNHPIFTTHSPKQCLVIATSLNLIFYAFMRSWLRCLRLFRDWNSEKAAKRAMERKNKDKNKT